MAVVFESDESDLSWYKDPLPNGTAANNFERILELRKALCHPLTVNKDTGHLNKKYFSKVTRKTAMNWTDIELLQLYEGIFKYGVHSLDQWMQIRQNYLPQRDFIEIRLKLIQLLGTQQLQKYKGHTFQTEQQITDERNKNEREAKEKGTWSNKCSVALKSNVINLGKEENQKLTREEYEKWKTFVYGSSKFIFRDEKMKNTKVSNPKSKAKPKPKSKPKPKAQGKQKKVNKIEDMFSKQIEKQTQEKSEKISNTQPKNASLPKLPESSDDEEMVCVD